MLKSHQSNKRIVALKVHILCIGVFTRTGGLALLLTYITGCGPNPHFDSGILNSCIQEYIVLFTLYYSKTAL